MQYCLRILSVTKRRKSVTDFDRTLTRLRCVLQNFLRLLREQRAAHNLPCELCAAGEDTSFERCFNLGHLMCTRDQQKPNVCTECGKSNQDLYACYSAGHQTALYTRQELLHEKLCNDPRVHTGAGADVAETHHEVQVAQQRPRHGDSMPETREKRDRGCDENGDDANGHDNAGAKGKRRAMLSVKEEGVAEEAGLAQGEIADEEMAGSQISCEVECGAEARAHESAGYGRREPSCEPEEDRVKEMEVECGTLKPMPGNVPGAPPIPPGPPPDTRQAQVTSMEGSDGGDDAAGAGVFLPSSEDSSGEGQDAEQQDDVGQHGNEVEEQDTAHAKADAPGETRRVRPPGRGIKKKRKGYKFSKPRKCEKGAAGVPPVNVEVTVLKEGTETQIRPVFLGQTLSQAEVEESSQWMLCEDMTLRSKFTAKIVAYGSNGMVLVHFKGWNEKRREWVPRDRLTPVDTKLPGVMGSAHVTQLGASANGKGKEEKEMTEEPVPLNDVLELACYECGEDGPLVCCRNCNRHMHAECAGDGHQGPLRPKKAGCQDDKSKSAWLCRFCVRIQNLGHDKSQPKASHQSYSGAILRMQQLCDKFPMKHPFASFGRQVVRVYELAAQLQAAGESRDRIEEMLHATDSAGRVTATSVLTRLAAAAGGAGVALNTSSTDGPASGGAIGARSIGQQGGSKDLHCDVCGYNQVEVGCTTCSAVFHLRCLNLELAEDEDMPADWRCRICLHEAKARGALMFRAPDVLPDVPPAGMAVSAVGGHSGGGELVCPEARDCFECGLGASSCVLPDEPVLCSSCGFFEQESVLCVSCGRWFCFGCTALALQTLPAGKFACPECFGIETYDEQLAQHMAIVRARIAAGEACHLEIDMFVQTVFDLFGTCAWTELGKNLEILIELVDAQIKAGIVPAVVPFHSIHYPMPKTMVRDIAVMHSEQALQRVLMAECGYRQPVQEEIVQLWQADKLEAALLPAPVSPGLQPPTRRLRIGYLSADFCNHPTADLMQSALLLHDKSKFEIFLYAITRHDSSQYRQVLQREITHFRSLPKRKSDKQCAQIIADDAIHILINLNSHTAGERNGIFALRPAPVQVVYLAFPGTHGASYLDYNVVDKTVSPSEHRELYTEKLVYMPHCYQTNSFKDLYPEVLSSECLPARAAHGLPEDAIVYCTFNRLGRITPDLLAVWANILQRVPKAVLWLYKHPKTAVLRLLRQVRRLGMPAHRIVFAGPVMPKTEHLKRLTLADVYLDTLVYNGHTTGSDVLWAGVPMVTIQGDTFPSRVGASLARAVDMEDMVTYTLHEYEERAVELGINAEKRAEWRALLAKKRLEAPLFDTARWVASFEEALDVMWDRHAEVSPPCLLASF